jgi:hypothetical protein
VAQQQLFPQRSGDLITVNRGVSGGQIDDRLHSDGAAVAEQRGQPIEQERADLFDTANADAGGDRFGGHMHIHHSPRPRPSRIKPRRHDPQRSVARLAGRVRVDDRLRLVMGRSVSIGTRLGSWDELTVVFDRSLGEIIGFGGSVPLIVSMVAQQPQRLGGLGEDADGLGSAHLHRVVIALTVEDVGDPIHGGLEPDRVPSGRPGNDQLQPVLGVAAQPDKPLRGGCGGPLLGAVRIRGDDRRIE